MMNREECLALLEKYNKEPFHIEHGVTVEKVMRYFAETLGYGDEADFWATVGLLHDIDFEMWPEQHCVKAPELLREAGFDDRFINAVVCHGWGMTGSTVKPEHEMERVLFACDELTGLIGAAALMRPSKSCDDMELKSLKKKFKDKKFAAGCSREVITQGAEMLGWDLDKLLNDTLEAMKTR
ncbi:MAG: hydrolase [Clostridia bacterium]|nr:hydrolase [Clostridia bacterium]MBQ2326048.1 hydrolase [Clostridia bacterium]MBQ9925814.1 hydrolase [Clostridia bacterium]